MRLQNIQHLPPLPNTRGSVTPGLALLKINQQSQRLLARGHELDDALDHEDQVLRLAGADVRVLPSGVQVVAGPSFVVVAKQDLLARLVLGRDVVPGE